MKRRKATKELLSKLIGARKSGKTYTQIEKEFKVSRWTCIRYLKDIEFERDYEGEGIEDWLKYEKQAREVLVKKGFTNILDLNKICNNPYWDYYAERENKRWLIDVTINNQKCIINKVGRMIKGFESAILYKDEDWKLIRIDVTQIG